MAQKNRNRLTRMLFPGGSEPDPRFTLANERTFLSWIRTSLALLVGGLATYALRETAGLQGQMWHTIGFLMPIFACILTVFAVFRWVRVERAMRESRPLPAPAGVPLILLVVAISSAIAVSLSIF